MSVLAEKYPPSVAQISADKEFMELSRNMHGKSEARVAFGAANMEINISSLINVRDGVANI